MAKLPRRGLMAMEAIGGVEDVGCQINELGQIAPQMPTENAIYVQPLHPEHFDLAVKPGKRITGQQNDDEGVDFFMEPLVPGEVPELSDDVHLIAAIESQLQDLIYVEESMLQAGGMCRQFAMEAQKVIPNFGQVAVNYYSETPTATRYKAALEELSAGIWAAIAAGVAVVIAAIAKFVSWMLGRRKGASDDSSGGSSASAGVTSAQQKDVVEQAKKMPEDVKTMAKSMNVGQQTINKAEGLLSHTPIKLKNEHGKEFEIHSFQDIINNILTDQERFERAKKFFNTRDGYTHDVINNGAFSKLMADTASRMGAVTNAMTMKCNVMESIIRRDLGSHAVSDEMKNVNGLSAAGKAVELTISGRTMTLNELARYLDNQANELKEKSVSNPIMFDKLFTTMARAYESHSIDVIMHQSAVLVECLLFVNEQLTKMNDVARNLSTDGVPGALTQGIGPQVREVLSSLQQEVLALTKISGHIVGYFKVLEQLASHALGFGIEVVRKTADVMRAQKQTIPEGWQQMLDELNEQKKAITTAYFSMKKR